MKKLFNIFSILVFISVLFIRQVSAQGDNVCNGASPFCTGTTYNFPLNTGTSSELGPNYGCLMTQPNPVWYYLRILDPGNITINLQSTPSQLDVDFICWGPFTSPSNACTQVLAGGGTEVDCSYSTSYTEECNISNALTGQYYMLLITNYSNQPTNVTFSQTNIGAPNDGSTDCAVMSPCLISNATATPSNCTSGPNTFSVSGSITFANAPTTGTMIITDQQTGISQTLNAPFTSPLNYNLTGIVSDGVNHTLNIIFSADQFCVYNVTYAAPASCNSCFVDAGPAQSVCGLTATMGAITQAGDYNFQWSCSGANCSGVTVNNPNSPNAIVTVPSSGTYAFTWSITNQFGISCTDQVMVKFTDIPTSTFSFTPVVCFDNNATTLTFTGTGSPTSTYNWDFGGGIAIPGGNGVGPHGVSWATSGNHIVSLTVVDGICSSLLTQHTLTTPTDLVTLITTTPVLCNSGSSGQVEIQVSGGVSGYTYSYSNCLCPTHPETAGSYSVTTTDANGCTNIDTFSILQPQPIFVTQEHTNLICNNDNSGTAIVHISGGTPGYTYNWQNNPGLNDSIQTGLAAGSYLVNISDSNGCTVNTTIQLIEPSPVTVSLSNQTDVSCSGLCDGSSTAFGTGGVSPVSYNWGTVFTPLNNTLCAGSHTVTVSDANGCPNTASVTISEPPLLTASITSQTNVSCSGGANGTATVTANGGTPIYQYNWSTGAVTQTVGNLIAGQQIVMVTDTKGCTDTAMLTITQPSVLQALVLSQTNATCYGVCNGQARVSPVGGTPPYTWNWGQQGNIDTVSTLCSGTHSVSLTDAFNCTSTTSFTISQPTQVTAQITNKVNVSCNGFSDGQATVSGGGGTPGTGYTYLWSLNTGSQATTTAVNLAAGTYTVTVTDQNSCTDTASCIITQPLTLTAGAAVITNFNGFHISCNGMSDADITLTTEGGTTPWGYQWSNSAVTQNLNNVSAGTYSVTVTDYNGCIAYSAVTVNEPSPLVAVIDSISDYNGYGISCSGAADGKIYLTVTGGAPVYSYDWTGGGSQQDYLNISQGQYFVTVTDANGCITYTDTSLSGPTALTLVYATTDINCFGYLTGSIDLDPGEGVPPYSFTWSNGQNTEVINSLAAGNYTVTVKDQNNCAIYEAISITQTPQLLTTVSNDTVICIADPILIFVYPSGGSGAYSYYWNDTPGSYALTVSPADDATYSVYVKDINGCVSDTDLIHVSVLPPVVLDVFASDDSVCFGSPIFINHTITGCNDSCAMYYLDTLITDFPLVIYPTNTQNFIFYAKDEICTNFRARDTVKITVLPTPSPMFNPNLDSGCEPLQVYFYELLDEPDATYFWEFNDEGTTSDSRNPSHIFENPGTYDIKLKITSQYGCSGSNTRIGLITVHPKPEAGFYYTPDQISIVQPEVSFINTSENAISALWFFGDGDSITKWEPVHFYKKPGRYDVIMVASSDHGCIDSVKTLLTVKDEYSIYVPTAFSPDGDGLNDEFMIFGSGIDETTFKISISDRWGQLIYESKNRNEKWNGKHMNRGPIVPAGTYVWMVSCYDLGGVMHQKAGWVTVIN